MYRCLSNAAGRIQAENSDLQLLDGLRIPNHFPLQRDIDTQLLFIQP